MRKSFIPIIMIILSFTRCISPDNGENEPVLIEALDYTSTLYIEQDNVTVKDSTFHDIDNHAIEIRNAKNIIIDNCTISNIGRFGILLRGDGSTEDVIIKNCAIFNIGVHGIHAAKRLLTGVDHPGLTIQNCLIYDTGTAAEWPGHDHGIYIQSTNFFIENNTIYNSFNGHGISVRNCGIVRGNMVYNNYGSAIDYYNDHKSSENGVLLIENNICWENDLLEDQENRKVIDLGYTSLNPSYIPETIIIRFNTVVSYDALLIPIFGDSEYITSYQNGSLLIYGNLAVNAAGEDIFQITEQATDNYGTTSLSGFAQTIDQPYDFHLLSSSAARNFYNGPNTIPEKDFDGENRITPGDAGADQFY